jgi:hypothetical protein
MKTIRYKKDGEYLVFVKFDILPIDPEKTRIANQKAINELPERKQASQKIAENIEHEKTRRGIERQARRAKYKGNTIASELRSLEIVRAKMLLCAEELSELNASLTSKTKALLRENPVYSHPRRDEVPVSDVQIEDISALLLSLKNEQISLTIEFEDKIIIDEEGKPPIMDSFPKLVGYEKIIDIRGKKYLWKQDGAWKFSEPITEIGIAPTWPDGGIEDKDLTPDQMEEVRMQELSDTDKEIEKNEALEAALTNAATMKSKLEIQDDAEALRKSQLWYQEQVDLIERKYL